MDFAPSKPVAKSNYSASLQQQVIQPTKLKGPAYGGPTISRTLAAFAQRAEDDKTFLDNN